MSITVVQDKGVTVITVETDRTSMLPPLCQILKTLCFSSRSCSLFKRAEGLKQSNIISALGTMQIMVGLFNIGLGPGRISLHPEDFAHLGVAYWLGGVLILTGFLSLLANRFPCPFSMGLSVLMNIVGSVLSVIGLYMFVRDIADITEFAPRLCDGNKSGSDYCIYVAAFYQRMITGMDITMIILGVVTLAGCVSLTVLGIKALYKLGRKEEAGDDEIHHPEKEALLTERGA